MESIITFFNVKGLMPHGYCLVWNPLLLAAHVLSDSVIFMSYMIIPAVIIYVKRKRNDIGFNKLYTLFFLFISFCGITHLFSIIVLWYPCYGLEGLSKILTAIVSLTSACFLFKEKENIIKLVMPKKLEKKNKELKDMSMKLQQLNANLEREVSKRTIDFKKVNEELLAFSYIISHDFREPIRGVRQFSEIIDKEFKERLPKQAQQYIEVIYRNSLKISELLDSLTEFATAGKNDKDNQSSFSLNEIIAKVIKDHEQEITKHKIVIEVSPGLPSIEASYTHLYRILTNIIQNSIKYADNTKKIKKVSIYSIKNTLYIEDNGIGIPKDEIAACQNLFYKINPRTEGTGMGLSICKKLCLVNNIDFSLINNKLGGITVTLVINQ